MPPEGGTDILVVAGASLDLLHFAGRSEPSPGGAGLYTALAAACAGARTTMLAPRPEPMPPELAPAAERLAWIGPPCAIDELPRFEIAHDGHGHATLVNAFWGAEERLTPDRLPRGLAGAAFVHVAALRNAARQLGFVRACRRDGRARLSAGTYGRCAATETADVRELIEACDVFFLNENECRILFGGLEAARARTGQLLFVTRGARGARVLQGGHATDVPTASAAELDPTGAGDTFCGATLAALARGAHPVLAAREGVALATQMIEAVGPARLLADRPAPGVASDPRCVVAAEAVARVAERLASLPEVQPLAFTGDGLPLPGAARALDYFFTATLQQFGFWEEAAGRYGGPLVAPLAGRTLKGSDYLWHAWLRATADDPEWLDPGRQAGIEERELARVFRSDDGRQPMPALALHLEAARSYGRDLQALGLGPAALLALAQREERPRQALLQRLDHVGGYKEDPLRKKSALLALVLEQRPERFLRAAPGEDEWPVVDYHVMRSCLRLGLVRVEDDALRTRLERRELLAAQDEWAVRLAASRAMAGLARLSGRGMGAVDAFLFGARLRCPETSEPDCARCAADPVCAHRKELFQPVLRTTAY